MNKIEFLKQLKKNLSGLPENDIEERLAFYDEMIDDRMEDGLTEEEATADIGSPEEVAKQIISETPISKLVKEKIKKNSKPKVWETIFLVLGFPIWGSLLISAFAVILSVYASLWAVVISLWGTFISLCACSLGLIAAGIIVICKGNSLLGIAFIASAMVCAGISILFCFVCSLATKGMTALTRITLFGIKKLFVKKEAEQ